MKKYFVKYLPVEGEIKKGDKVRYKWPNKDFTLETVLEIAKNGDVKTDSKKFPFHLKNSTQLFKLFLCSRDNEEIIGEVSEDATWVKEGDEFDEKEVRVIYGFDIEKKFRNGIIQHTLKFKDYPEDWQITDACSIWADKEESGQRYGYSTNYISANPYPLFVEIQGPCGHFH